MITIRAASLADSQQLAGLISNAAVLQMRFADGVELARGIDWHSVAVAKLTDRQRALAVAEQGATLVGYVETRVVVSPGRRRGLLARLLRPLRHVPTSSGSIEDLYVVDAVRRVGVGSQLAQFALAALHKRGVRSVTAAVWAENQPSLAFHRKLGFNTLGVSLERTESGASHDQ